MSIKAIFFDMGGVIGRTESRQSRTLLAESLGLTYEEMDKAVFENESSLRASLGLISEDRHWQNVASNLGMPESEVERLAEEFFGGDRVDQELVNLMREMRKTIKVGLISNAWSGLREWIVSKGFDDAFDTMVISAEVGIVKPDARIFQIALSKLQVNPDEAIFVDDMLKNVEAARKLGMHGVHFQNPENALKEIQLLLEDR